MRYFFFINLHLYHRVFCQMIQEKKNNIKEKQKIISFIVFLQRLFFVIIFCRTLNMKIFFSVQYITWDKEYLFEKKSLQEIGQRIISHTGYHSKRFNNISIDNYCSRNFFDEVLILFLNPQLILDVKHIISQYSAGRSIRSPWQYKTIAYTAILYSLQAS